jgi:hypothetical protein
MPNESGDLKLLGNFRKLIDLVSADTNYKPSNTALTSAAMNTQHTVAFTAAQDVPAKRRRRKRQAHRSIRSMT